MSNGLLSIGASALDAAYTALRTTGNNIANVNTPGYSREVTSFVSQVQSNTGSMYIGNGVLANSITRVYSDFLGQQTNLAQALSSQADSTQQLTAQINSLFANSSSGLGAAMDNFFQQIQNVANQPSSSATRQTALAAAQQMTDQFNTMSGQLSLMSQSANQQIGQEITTVNTTVSQIGSLNDQIALAQASGNTPNALLDQRNQAIQTLNQSIGVTTNLQSDGRVNIYLANGQPLLVGDKTETLAMGQDPINGQNTIVGTSSNGTIAALDPNNSGGGTIGALLTFQNQTLPRIENDIGRLAVTLSTQFNAVQAQGVDGNNQPGAPFFSTPSIATSSASTNADASSVSVTASYDNSPTNNVTNLQASDYQVAVQAGGQYVVTRLSDGTQTTFNGTPIAIDGMSIDFSGGAPAVGDKFNIEPVRNGAANLQVAITQGSQIAAGSPLQATLGSNSGSLAVGNLNLAPLTVPVTANPNLLDGVTLNFTSPTSFTATDTTTSASLGTFTYSPGQPISLNGWALTLTGTPANGDSVSVGAGTNGSGDNRNAQLMAQLQGAAIAGGTSLDNAYAGVVADVGAIASTAKTDQTSKNAILQNATTAQSSVSGVNLDEEAAALMQFQQQYQAAAKLIQTATNVFDAILAAAGAA
jgi:flagellar hook-associated protein 1